MRNGSPKRHYKDLKVWHAAQDLAEKVYRLTHEFPQTEIYGLTAQMRSCAASVPANIAEGDARRSDKDFLRFLRIAAGSLAELETFLDLARRLTFASSDEIAAIETDADEVGKMLYGLIAKVRHAIDQ